MASICTTTFTYKPLEGPGRIRLVILMPSEDESARIECRLIHGWITSPPLYEALSYCWGNEVASSSITINGDDFMVRENLLGALRRLRRTRSTRLIWIDAICINQADIDERNSQVSQMRHIYSNADSVAVWLGENLDGAEAAIQFIPDLITLLERDGLGHREESSLKLLTGLECVSLLAMLGRLFTRPWWRRVWIVQEVSVATRLPIIHCGSETFSWKLLRQLHIAIHKSRVYDLLLQPGSLPNSEQAAAALHVLKWTIQPVTSLVLVRDSMVDTKARRNLSFFIWLTKQSHASDPRDKIFALIGLTNPLIRVPIDYNRGTDWVNLSTTIQVLQEDKDLRSLGWMNVVEESGESQLPSWMNHFTQRAAIPSMISTRVFNRRNTTLYSADGNEDSIFDKSFVLLDDNRVLVVEGIRFDKLNELGNDPYTLHTSEEKTLSSVFHEWKELAEATNAHAIGNKQKSNFWRTILLDRKFFEFRNQSVYETDILQRLGENSSFCPTNALEEERLITALDEINYALRRFFISANGRVGLAPPKARVGDLICVLFGAEVPFVLRPLAGANYQLIGECYLHGVMDAPIRYAAQSCAKELVNYYTNTSNPSYGWRDQNPDYWAEAGTVLGSLIDYWYYTTDSQFNNLTVDAITSQVGPSGDFSPTNQTKSQTNSDQSLWGLAAMSAAEYGFPSANSSVVSWDGLAKGVFLEQAGRRNKSICGGALPWKIFPDQDLNNTVDNLSNGRFLNLAARLGAYSGNQTYLDWANTAWDWALAVGLVSADYHFYDSTLGAANCTSINHIEWTAVVGPYLHGLAVMWNVTADQKLKTRIDGILKTSSLFFSNGIMKEVACEDNNKCDREQLGYKGQFSRFMAATVQLAPWTTPTVMSLLHSSGTAALQQGSGGVNGTTCGSKWTQAYDNTTGAGQQMSALQVIQGNLILYMRGPSRAPNNTRPASPKYTPEAPQPTVSHKSIAGIVVGAVVGGVLVVTAIVFSVMKFKKRRKGAAANPNEWAKPELEGHGVSKHKAHELEATGIPPQELPVNERLAELPAR